jgi:hypothetical protein
MNNRNFAKLAMMGLVGGCLLGSSPVAAEQATNNVTNNKGVLLANSCGKNSCGGAKEQGSRSYVADNSNSTRGSMDSDRRMMDKEPIPAGNDKNGQPTASGCGSKTRPNNNNRSQVADNGCKSNPSRPSNGCKSNSGYVSNNNDEQMTRPSNGCKSSSRYVSDSDDEKMTRPSNGMNSMNNGKNQPAKDGMSNKRDSVNQSNQTAWNQTNQNGW